MGGNLGKHFAKLMWLNNTGLKNFFFYVFYFEHFPHFEVFLGGQILKLSDSWKHKLTPTPGAPQL